MSDHDHEEPVQLLEFGSDHHELGDVELEQPSANEYREAAKRWIDFTKRGIFIIKAHSNQMLAFDCWLLALGWHDLLGCDNQVALADVHGVTKASVSSSW